MNRIDSMFLRFSRTGRKALVGYFTAGFPDYEACLALLHAAVEAGVDLVELGVPFSDPTADGPVIQATSASALEKGMTLGKTLDLVRDLRKLVPDTPIVLFSYYNPVLRYGVKKFHEDAVVAGADGVLLVDLPPEESDEVTSQWSPSKLHLIRLVAPTTGDERLETLRDKCRGFVYAISRAGVTGVERELELETVAAYLKNVKQHTDVPVCVGFGVSSAADIRELSQFADGVVVGSALVKYISENSRRPDLPDLVAEKVRELCAGFSRPSPGG